MLSTVTGTPSAPSRSWTTFAFAPNLHGAGGGTSGFVTAVRGLLWPHVLFFSLHAVDGASEAKPSALARCLPG